MLVEVKKTTESDVDRFKEIILKEPGPFLVVLESKDKGMNTDPIDIRIIAKSANKFNVTKLCFTESKPCSWTISLPVIVSAYKLLPKGFQVTLTQTV